VRGIARLGDEDSGLYGVRVAGRVCGAGFNSGGRGHAVLSWVEKKQGNG